MTNRERKILEKLDNVLYYGKFHTTSFFASCNWAISASIHPNREEQIIIAMYEPYTLSISLWSSTTGPRIGDPITIDIRDLKEEHKQVYSYIGQHAIANGIKLQWTL